MHVYRILKQERKSDKNWRVKVKNKRRLPSRHVL